MAAMIFITLYKFRRKITKADVDNADKVFSGTRSHGAWWTLGRYDAVRVYEAADAKAAMKLNLALEGAASETLVAVPREEAVKLV
jgi:uncharacterized protein with GYD domain